MLLEGLLYVLLVVLVFMAVKYVQYEQEKAVAKYQTVDGLHTNCAVIEDKPMFGIASYTLECPDGYIQHGGSYQKMKD